MIDRERNGFYFGNGFFVSSTQTLEDTRSEESEHQKTAARERGNIQQSKTAENWRKYRNESFYDFPSSWLIGNFRFRLSLTHQILYVEIFLSTSSTSIAMCCTMCGESMFFVTACSLLSSYLLPYFYLFSLHYFVSLLRADSLLLRYRLSCFLIQFRHINNLVR